MQSEHYPQEQRVTNTDSREQRPDSEAGTRETYGNDSRPIDAEKLRPDYKRRSRSGFIFVPFLIILLLVGTIMALKFTIISQSTLPERVFTVSGHSKLVVDNDSGYIHLHTGSANSIIVQGTRHLQGFGSVNDIQYTYSQNGDTVTIQSHGDMEWFRHLWAEESIDYDITVPTSIDVEVQNGSGQVTLADVNGNIDARTGSGSIDGSSLAGTVSLSTGSGNIKASHLKEHALLSTGSGSIDLEGANGDINAQTGSGGIDGSNLAGSIQLATGSGSITVTNTDGQLQLSTGSGSITANNAHLTDHSALETHSGGINFSGTLEPHGSYSMQANSGSIDVALPGNTSLQVNATTGSGTVSNDFTNSQTNDGSSASLTLHTDSGSIRIHKQ